MGPVAKGPRAWRAVLRGMPPRSDAVDAEVGLNVERRERSRGDDRRAVQRGARQRGGAGDSSVSERLVRGCVLARRGALREDGRIVGGSSRGAAARSAQARLVVAARRSAVLARRGPFSRERRGSGFPRPRFAAARADVEMERLPGQRQHQEDPESSLHGMASARSDTEAVGIPPRRQGLLRAHDRHVQSLPLRRFVFQAPGQSRDSGARPARAAEASRDGGIPALSMSRAATSVFPLTPHGRGAYRIIQ